MLDVTNREGMKKFQVLLEIANFSIALRQQWVQERVLVRGQPMNEISSIINGNPVSMPQFQQFRPGIISDTPIGQFVYQSAALDQQKWSKQADISMQKAQMQQQMIGGMMSLGGGCNRPEDRKAGRNCHKERRPQAKSATLGWRMPKADWKPAPQKLARALR